MNNKIIHGDAFIELPKMDDKSVDLIITDPPYDFNLEQKEFLQNQFHRISRNWIIVFSPPENQWILPADQYLFWIKPISTKNTSRRYSRFVEMIFIYGDGVWNTDRHWSQYTNVFTDLVDTSKIHPFRKPPSLLKRLILNHSKPGDIILDPFFGSGTTLSAADSTSRKYIGIESNQDYFEVVKRWIFESESNFLPEVCYNI